MSWFIANLPRKKSAIAGVAGGLLAALFFLSGTAVFGAVVGRLLGACILGFCIGLMIAMAEAIGRDAWLILRWGPREESTLALGKRAILMGSSSETHIHLPKDQGFAPIVSAITLTDGTIEYEDKSSGRKQVLRNGSKLKIGTLEVEVRVA